MRETEAVPSRRDDVIWRRMGDESVLLNATTENYYSLNEVGTRTWELIDGTLSAGEIASELANEYDAPVAQIEADVHALIAELRTHELLS